jgi:hypothetical protein
MEAKLTLKLDVDAIQRAKNYLKTHKNDSLSKLVEQFFNSLTASDPMEHSGKLPPIVSGLAGCLKRAKDKNVEDLYTDYLIEKYQ